MSIHRHMEPAFPSLAISASLYWRLIVFGLLLAILAVFFSPDTRAAAPTDAQLIVLMSKDSRPYQRVVDALLSHLTRLGSHVSPRVIHLSDLTALESPGKNDLTITIGMSASRYAIQHWPQSPVLTTLISQRAFAELVENASPRTALSAVYLDQPLARQIQFLRQLLPASKRVGTLLGKTSQTLEPMLVKLLSKEKMTLLARKSNDKQLASDIRYLARRTDVILAIPDRSIMTPNHAKWLLYMAYLRKTPVIGFSNSYVDAGALAAIYTSPEQNGRQAAEVAASFLNTPVEQRRLAAPSYPADFSISINHSVARSLGLVLRDSQQIRLNLLALEGRQPSSGTAP